MKSAYSDIYLDDSMSNLGEALDYSSNALGISMDDFMNLFIASGYADLYASGVSKVVSGLSGTELVLNVLDYANIKPKSLNPVREYDCSIQYWCGYILAYFQWKTGLSFKEIIKYLSLSDIEKTYSTLHEASEDKAVDAFLHIINRRAKVTNLQRIRKASGMSQRGLAKQSGVSIRSIQQYEQKAKDINKASINTVCSLASTLGCKETDLLEAL